MPSFPLFILQGRKEKEKKMYEELLIQRDTYTHTHNVGTAAHPTPTHPPRRQHRGGKFRDGIMRGRGMDNSHCRVHFSSLPSHSSVHYYGLHVWLAGCMCVCNHAYML